VPDFSPATAAWFASAFAGPTAAQEGAWSAIGAGSDTLVIAPTGSGKTLAAFLWALDQITSDPERRVAGPKSTESAPQLDTRREGIGPRVLYISPLKALAVDVERNLRSPLAGIRREAQRLGIDVPDISVGVRTGDTSPDERRRMVKNPPDILITTPESLFLLLTSQAREILHTVDTVIIDEIHALAGTKRGAHLALSLERLEGLTESSAQRIGLSATVRPVEEVARYLRPDGNVSIVNPPAQKAWDLSVVVPVPDMAAMGTELEPDGSAAADPRRTSIWPHVEERIVDLVAEQRSTLVFANSRGLAERLTGRLNEVGDERELTQPLARAHHGSVSREQRAIIEDDLKTGRLPAVVATSSLELGIDMGAVDLVVQVESPPSVASGLQRVGRAGHQVGAVSRGVVFPKFRGDLLQSAIVIERMRSGSIEALSMPRNPLDVLAQQIVAMAAMDDWLVDDLLAVVTRAAPFTDLPPALFYAVLDMLAGKYPSDDFAELRPRIIWDRTTDTVSGRPGAQRLAVTSGGTIPDRGLYPVVLIGADQRVGELDEEMVYESRVGDVFALGATSWRIEEITPDRVLVSPAPGQIARLPFWHGDAIGRPVELGRALGEFLRASTDGAALRERLIDAGLDEWAQDNLIAYLAEQRAATGRLPDDRTIVVERFRDELGDWRIAIHTPYGARVHAPWALALTARLESEYGVSPQVMHSDDGIVLRLPETMDDAAAASVVDLVVIDPEEVTVVVEQQIGGSALFAGRFRECAARSLLLPRRRPGRRSPLWQQRQKSAHLLEVAARYPDFPVVLEAVRECLQDVFDMPALRELLEQVRAGKIRVVDVETDRPSPFAQSLVFGYVAAFLYEGDSPLAERRAAALTLDADLLSQLLGPTELRDILDADSITATERQVGRWDFEVADVEALVDLLRLVGPLDADALGAHTIPDDVVAAAIDQRRALWVRIAGRDHLAAIEDAGRLRDALGAALPPGIPDAFLEIVADPLGDLVSRYARTHGPFTTEDVAAAFGLGVAVAQTALNGLVERGRLVAGGFRPDHRGTEYCEVDVLRQIRRRTVAALRHEIEPVPPATLATFLPQWQGLTDRGSGADALFATVEQLAGAPLPASQLESVILPGRVRDYSPSMLDELLSTGEVVWWGAGSLPGRDGWLCLAPTDLAPLLVPLPGDVEDPFDVRILEALHGHALFARDIAAALSTEVLIPEVDVRPRLTELLWSGHVTNDTFLPVRAHVGMGARSSRAASRRRGRVPTRRGRLGRPSGSSTGPADGRWTLAPTASPEPAARALAQAESLLDRYGVVTREIVQSVSVPGGFAAAYRVLRALEDAGRCRRAYVIEGQGAAQFALAGAIDAVRACASARDASPITMAAADPAQPYGAALPWPESSTRPSRSAGALVTLGGVTSEAAVGPVFYLARGHRSVTTWPCVDPASAARSLVSALRGASVNLQRVDGVEVASADPDVIAAFVEAGFARTPSGLRLRP
jgi:ATP-dependent Lhr-like helicase